MTKSQAERAGFARVYAGIGIMVLSLVVAYFGGAMAPAPELVNPAAEGWMLVIMITGLVVNLRGVGYLKLAERISEPVELKLLPSGWHASP